MGDVFIKLLNMSITAGWLILAVLCVRFLFRNMPKWIHCVLWGVVAVRLVVPFSVESAFSLQPSAEPIKSSAIVEGEVMPYVPSIDSSLAVVKDTVNPILVKTFAYQDSESAAPLQVFSEIAGMVWLCGMIALMILAIGSMIRLLLLVREAVPYGKRVFICDAVNSPFILGLLRPRIYLSSALSKEETDYVLAHEKAHIRRKDHIWKPLGYLILCIYWFHPLCWIAYSCLCKDIELACDEKVIRNMSFANKKEYSRVLLSCAAQRRLVLSCPLAFGEVGVKERVKSVLKYKKPAILVTIAALAVSGIVAVCFLTNPSSEYQAESENSVYGNIVAGLGDEDAYAFLGMEYEYDVMLATDLIYDAGTEKQAAVYCDVYYPVGGDAKKLGTVMSDGTAYPITFTKDGIFAASGHKVEKYVISENGALYLENGAYEEFDNVGNVTYIRKTGNRELPSTQQEYQALLNAYGSSQVVHFSYGAEGSVNEYQEEAVVLDEQVQEPDADDEGVYDELARVVGSVGLENAYPWNNTVEFKENADALIKMARDETGRFEIYGIMSEKYGTYGLLLNDWVGGQENWNFAYVPWMYTGTPSDQPILEPDGNGRYVFAYIDQYEDGVPWWEECILDCGYDTGHMELLSQEGDRLSCLPYEF